MDKADEVFWREFGIIVILLTIFTVAMFFLARSIGGQAFERALHTDRAIAERTMRVGSVRVGDPSATVEPTPTVAMAAAAAPSPAADAGGQSGESVYKSACMACHATGAAGAPKLDDKSAWQARAAAGVDALLQSVLNGKGAMPAKGGNPALSQADVENALAYMLEASGVSAGAGAQAAAPTPGATAAGGRPGQDVYNTACMACHATGAAGAPKLDDKAAWAQRLSAGVDVLVASVIKGKGAMPPKGGNASLSDGDIRNAVSYMVQNIQ